MESDRVEIHEYPPTQRRPAQLWWLYKIAEERLAANIFFQDAITHDVAMRHEHHRKVFGFGASCGWRREGREEKRQYQTIRTLRDEDGNSIWRRIYRDQLRRPILAFCTFGCVLIRFSSRALMTSTSSHGMGM